MQKGTEGRQSLKGCAFDAEKGINEAFYSIYYQWMGGKLQDMEFYKAYEQQLPDYWNEYVKAFAGYKL